MITIPLYYIYWHYTLAFSDMARMWRNLLWFVWHFFSVGLLLHTLISPWKRMAEKPTPGFNPGEVINRFIANGILRVVGFVARLTIILMGIVSVAATVMLGPLMFLFWLFAPFILLGLALLGVYYLTFPL